MIGLERVNMPSMQFFFFNDTATTEIYTLSLHDALPISPCYLVGLLDSNRAGVVCHRQSLVHLGAHPPVTFTIRPGGDRKSTRLNSSHANISYAVFCLKKKIYSTTNSSTLGSRAVIRPTI